MFKTLLSIVCLPILLHACNPSGPIAENQKVVLTGSWKFVADQELDSNNRVVKEDTTVDGLLIYTADGKMSVQLLWQGTRRPILTDSIMNQDGISSGLGLGTNTWTSDQARLIIDTYDAYFGNYIVDWKDNIVTHVIDGTLRPEKTGTTYRRIFAVTDDTLLLRSTDPSKKWQAKWVRN
jgi:hypothetical protein